MRENIINKMLKEVKKDGSVDECIRVHSLYPLILDEALDNHVFLDAHPNIKKSDKPLSELFSEFEKSEKRDEFIKEANILLSVARMSADTNNFFDYDAETSTNHIFRCLYEETHYRIKIVNKDTLFTRFDCNCSLIEKEMLEKYHYCIAVVLFILSFT